MTPTPPLLTVLLVLGLLTACGADPSGRSTTGTDDGSRAGTPEALAAGVLAHLDGVTAREARGGLVDAEDTRELSVEMTLDLGDGRNSLSVSAPDPEFLPGDRGLEECPPGANRPRRGMEGGCEVLDDGTVVHWVTSDRGFSDDNRHGSAAMLMVTGPDRELELFYETYDADARLAGSMLTAIAGDDRIGWSTTADLLREGEALEGFARYDRVG